MYFFFETLWLARRCWCAFPRLDQGARSDDISLWVYVSIPLTSFNMCMIICVHAVYSHEFSNMHVNYLHLYAYCIYDLYIYIYTCACEWYYLRYCTLYHMYSNIYLFEHYVPLIQCWLKDGRGFFSSATQQWQFCPLSDSRSTTTATLKPGTCPPPALGRAYDVSDSWGGQWYV